MKCNYELINYQMVLLCSKQVLSIGLLNITRLYTRKRLGFLLFMYIILLFHVKNISLQGNFLSPLTISSMKETFNP